MNSLPNNIIAVSASEIIALKCPKKRKEKPAEIVDVDESLIIYARRIAEENLQKAQKKSKTKK